LTVHTRNRNVDRKLINRSFGKTMLLQQLLLVSNNVHRLLVPYMSDCAS